MKKRFLNLISISILIQAATGCSSPVQESLSSNSGYLYVTSGACYSGFSVTTFTNTSSSNMVYRLNLSNGQRDMLIADYFSTLANPGDSPVTVIDNDSTSVLVLVENTTTASLRRIEKVEKATNGNRSTYNGNTTALSAQVRNMIRLNDNYLLVSKSTAAEKVLQTSTRLLVGANPWLSLSTPASSCTTSATLISAVQKLNNGTLVFAHAGAGSSRIGTVSSLGYAVASDCKAGQNSPTANAYPTAMAYDSTNNILIVAYGGNSTATDINSIYTYSINESTGAISNAQKIYDSNGFGSTYNYLLFGVSAMTLDPSTNSLYVATAVSTATTAVNYKIEKFSYNPSLIGTSNSSVLSYQGTFYNNGNDTKCISSMMVAQ